MSTSSLLDRRENRRILEKKVGNALIEKIFLELPKEYGFQREETSYNLRLKSGPVTIDMSHSREYMGRFDAGKQNLTIEIQVSYEYKIRTLQFPVKVEPVKEGLAVGLHQINMKKFHQRLKEVMDRVVVLDKARVAEKDIVDRYASFLKNSLGGEFHNYNDGELHIRVGEVRAEFNVHSGKLSMTVTGLNINQVEALLKKVQEKPV